MTAVMENEKRLVAPGETSLLFMARRKSLRLVMTPIVPVFGVGGRQVGEEPGQTVVFRDNVLRVPLEGEMTLEDGRTVDAAEVRAFLENHKRFGDSNEGFWRVDPNAPAPTEAEMRAIMEAAIELDEEKLEMLLVQERDGWCREAILNTAGDALERIRQVKAAAEAAASQPQGAKPEQGGKPADDGKK